MSETNLNDLSKIYLDQIAEKKKDDTYLEPDMKKRQANNEKARKDLMKGPQMKNPHFEEKKLDPVGQEDADVDNDGDVDSSDKYLKKRRKAIGKAMKKESFVKSDWRTSISEVMTDIESQPIKEKKVKNKVKINPTMGEAIEEIGGTLIEEIEVDDIEGVIECVYGELIEEGYSEDEVESAIEQALTEATVTVGHDTEGPKAERTRDKLKRKAKGFLGKVAVKAYNKAREAKVRATPAAQRAKTSAKRGIRKLAQKVVDRMSEEVIGEAVYGGTPKKAEDKRMTVTNADKKGNTPAYQAYKAGDKRYKAADHMKEGIRDVDPEKGTAERKARLEKKRGMKLDDHPQYKKEEKDPFGRPGGKHGGVPKKGGGYDKAYQANMKKIKELEQKEEVEVAEADSLAAMQARREKRLAAQRKREGTTASGRDFGHDYSLSDKQQKARRDAEFKAGLGTKKEEVELDENRAAARAAGGYKDDSKKQPDPSKKGFTGIGNMSIDQIRKMSARIEKEKTKKESFSSWRDDLREVMTDTEMDKKVKEKKVSNVVKINPKLGEAVEAMGGEIIEATMEKPLSPAEIALQKKKGQIDMQILKKRRQAMSNMKSEGVLDAALELDKKMGELHKKVDKDVKRMKAGKKFKEEAELDEKINPYMKGILKKTPKGEDPKKGGVPYKKTGKMTEGLSVDDQMKISRDYNRMSPEDRKAANQKVMGKVKKMARVKDTRTDAQKMTDATGPRPGSRYRGD